MTDSNKNNLEWIPGEYKPRRQWTEEEIREATNYIKKERPDIWQELLREEEATGDLRELAAARIAGAMLRELHTGVDFCTWRSEIIYFSTKS